MFGMRNKVGQAHRLHSVISVFCIDHTLESYESDMDGPLLLRYSQLTAQNAVAGRGAYLR